MTTTVEHQWQAEAIAEFKEFRKRRGWRNCWADERLYRMVYARVVARWALVNRIS